MADYASGHQPLDDAKAPPVMALVIAPSTLQAGYTFEALVGGDPAKPFTVEVPPGGVTEGESFLAPVPENAGFPRLKAPTGKWKDGLFDFFKYGFCHPSLCCAIWCTQLGMAQVMSRSQLTWLGDNGPLIATRSTFKVVLTLVICYFVYNFALETAEYLEMSRYGSVPDFIPLMKMIGNFCFLLWVIYSLCRTRESIRARYSIPEERCQGCEDLCCSVFCNCCVVAQLARHTGEYESYPASCFTESGLPRGAPMAV